MYLSELSRTLRARRIRLEYEGERLQVRARREDVTAEVVTALRRQTPAQLRALAVWTCDPSAGGVRLERRPDLCRYVPKGTRVRAAEGEGVVLQVFEDRITVHLDGEDRTRFYEPEDLNLLP